MDNRLRRLEQAQDTKALARERLRAGFCPICGIAAANNGDDRWLVAQARDAERLNVAPPQCCCETCYESIPDSSKIKDDKEFSDYFICPDCPFASR